MSLDDVENRLSQANLRREERIEVKKALAARECRSPLVIKSIQEQSQKLKETINQKLEAAELRAQQAVAAKKVTAAEGNRITVAKAVAAKQQGEREAQEKKANLNKRLSDAEERAQEALNTRKEVASHDVRTTELKKALVKEKEQTQLEAKKTQLEKRLSDAEERARVALNAKQATAALAVRTTELKSGLVKQQEQAKQKALREAFEQRHEQASARLQQVLETTQVKANRMSASQKAKDARDAQHRSVLLTRELNEQRHAEATERARTAKQAVAKKANKMASPAKDLDKLRDEEAQQRAAMRKTIEERLAQADARVEEYRSEIVRKAAEMASPPRLRSPRARTADDTGRPQAQPFEEVQQAPEDTIATPVKTLDLGDEDGGAARTSKTKATTASPGGGSSGSGGGGLSVTDVRVSLEMGGGVCQAPPTQEWPVHEPENNNDMDHDHEASTSTGSAACVTSTNDNGDNSTTGHHGAGGVCVLN